jgi:hypothetical protein
MERNGSGRTKGLRLFAGAVALFLFATPASPLDDFGTWSSATVKYVQRGKWSLAAGGELRLDEDSTSVWFARLSQQTRSRLGDTWSFDANLS